MPEFQHAPFGNSDGSREDIDLLLSHFVEFDDNLVWKGLAMPRNDRTARVIVGRKGAGKTVYLRRLHADAVQEGSMYVGDVERKGLSTESVIRFCQMFPYNMQDESWSTLWRCAILRSTASHLMNSPRLKESVPEPFRTDLRERYTPILASIKVPSNAYQQAESIIAEHDTHNKISRLFHNDLWDELEWSLAEVINSLRPLCFYLDAVDDHFEQAPLYWLRCQKGLFKQVMQLMQDPRLGGRLHVFICIRDLVMASIASTSEHASRFQTDPHIRILCWDRNAIKYLFERKIHALDRGFFVADPDIHGRSFSSWLGVEAIAGPAQRDDEPIDRYLLRHTRLLPRDIIILGNHLCETIQAGRMGFSSVDIGTLVRRQVRARASFFGREQLLVSAKQLIVDLMPGDAVRRRYDNVYTSNQEYLGTIGEQLKELIKVIGRGRFAQSDLRSVSEMACEAFNEQVDPFSVLWQNGLVGYIEAESGRERAVFYSEDRMPEFKLENDRREYVFHSCVVEALGLTPADAELYQEI